MTDLAYHPDRIAVSPTQLAGWGGNRVGSTLRLNGPCPACRHDTLAIENLSSTSLEGGGATQAVTTRTVAASCNCGKEHQGRPDTPPRGCGRSWTATATIDDQGRVTLTAADDPYLAEAAEAFRSSADGELARLRTAAEKWIAGVSALTGVLGVAGLGLGAAQIRELALAGRVGVGAVVVLAAACAGLAIVHAYRAAYGWPRTRSVADDAELLSWYAVHRGLPRVTAGRLRDAVIAAGAALALLTVAAGLTWFLPTAKPDAPVLKVTTSDRAIICGTLLSSRADGSLRVRRADDGSVATLPLADVARLTAVEKC